MQVVSSPSRIRNDRVCSGELEEGKDGEQAYRGRNLMKHVGYKSPARRAG